MNKKLCPKCSSDNLAEFLYGMPVNGPELENDLENNKIILGGCSILENAPNFRCNESEYEWEGDHV